VSLLSIPEATRSVAVPYPLYAVQIAFADNADELAPVIQHGDPLIRFSRNRFATRCTVAESSTVMTGATMTSRTSIATSLNRWFDR
jgi:hypothetical protein